MVERVVCKDTAALARAAADEFVHRARAAKEPFTVALSGGRTPQRTYELLASSGYRKQVSWERVHVFWGDERNVPPDHADSNYRMAHEALLRHVPAQVHRIRTELGPEEAAHAYESELRGHFGGAVPRFDLVFLGMGADGHTASLFPDSAALHERRRWVVAPWVEAQKSFRITMTPVVLCNAACVVFLVSGADKAEAVRKVTRGGSGLPAELVRPTDGGLVWIVDVEAAAERA